MDDETTSPAGEAALPMADAEPAAAPPQTSGPAPRTQSGPGRRADWSRIRWMVALTAAVVLGAGGLGLLAVDDSNNQAAVRSLTTQNEALNGRNQNLTDQLNSTQFNLKATLGELADTKAQLAHPHLTIWNVPQQLKGSSWYLAGGIPDTFTYHLVATSDGPMSVSILTLEEYAKAIECVDYGTGTTNYCMHHSGAVMSWPSVTAVNYDFHLAEGCADYVSVFTSSATVTVTPNVSVTYNPASSTTGACA